jgi:imidazoleglycerol-phosphate dehydratase
MVALTTAGAGKAEIETGVAALDELIALVVRAARFDLRVESRATAGEEAVDAVGEALGRALAAPLGAEGARGIGAFAAPADEALAHVSVEASGRPLVVANVDLTEARIGGLRSDLLARFLDALAQGAGLTVHVRLLHGEDTRHVLEAIAKALGLALAEACAPYRPS